MCFGEKFLTSVSKRVLLHFCVAPAKLQLQKATIALAETKGKNYVFVLYFSSDFHFGLYSLFSLFLVPI